MSKIQHNRHDWAWIHADGVYEYSQCQHPHCGRIRRVGIRTGAVKLLTKMEVDDLLRKLRRLGK